MSFWKKLFGGSTSAEPIKETKPEAPIITYPAPQDSINPRAFEFLEKGHALRAQGSFHSDESIELFSKAIELAPDFALAWCCKGQVLAYQKKYSEALSCLEESVKLDPSDAGSWLTKAETEEELEMHNQALASYKEFMTLDLSEFESWELESIPNKISELESKISGDSKESAPSSISAGVLKNHGIVSNGKLFVFEGTYFDELQASLNTPGACAAQTNKLNTVDEVCIMLSDPVLIVACFEKGPVAFRTSLPASRAKEFVAALRPASTDYCDSGKICLVKLGSNRG